MIVPVLLAAILASLPGRGEAVTCQTITVGTGSYISTPGFPSDYSNDYERCWTFTASGNLIRVDVRDLKTESGFDQLEFYEGSAYGGISADDLDDIISSYTYTSTTTTLTLYFHSDSSIAYRGFQACVCSSGGSSCSCNWVDTSSSSSSSTSTGVSLSSSAIIGIVFGCVSFVVFIIIIVLCCTKCCKVTQSRGSNAAPVRNSMVRTGHPDRKHNQVIPAGNAAGPSIRPGGAAPAGVRGAVINPPNSGPQPPPYTGYNPQQGGVMMAPMSLQGPYVQPQPPSYPPPAYPPVNAAYPPVDAAYPPPPPVDYIPPPNAPPAGAPAGAVTRP